MDYWCVQGLMKRDSKNIGKVLDNILCGNTVLMDSILPMKKKEYEELWAKISQDGSNGDDLSTIRTGERSWQRLQDSINKTMRTLFVIGNNRRFSIVVDDDKIWIENIGENAKQQFGIKLQQFIRDNRKGIVTHTFVSTALLIIINLQVEKNDDTVHSCLVRGVNEMFGTTSSPTLRLDPNCVLKADRGYINDSFVKEAAKCGADVGGTCKRSPWYPFTYDQNQYGPNDRRTFLNKKGSPALFIKTTKVHNKQITAAAFRNGTDAIACTISSEHHFHTWDGIPLRETKNGSSSPTQHEYISRMDIPTTETIDQAEEELISFIVNNGVYVYTILQGTADWHLRRKFSLTSSQSDAVFRSLFSYAWKAGGTDKDAFACVATIIYGDCWQRQSQLLAEHELDNVEVIEAGHELTDFKSYVTMTITDNNEHSDAIEFLQQYVNEDRQLDEDEAKQVVNQLTDARRKAILAFLCHRISEDKRTKRTEKNDLVYFLHVRNIERKWMFYDKTALRATMSLYGLSGYGNWSKKEIVKKLAANEGAVGSAVNATADLNLAKKKAITAVLKNSFQQRFTGAKKSACVTGHKCEPLLIKKFVEAVNTKTIEIQQVDRIVAVYTTGLVAKRDEVEIKDSIDFILIVKLRNGQYQCWGGEAKTRTNGDTKNKEIHFQQERRPNGRIYSSGSDDMMHKDIQKVGERFQLMHHAYVYGFQDVLHLVGDWNANVIHCHHVEFSEGTFYNYKQCLKLIKEVALSWAYNNTDNIIPPLVLQCAAGINEIGDVDAFKSTFFLWLRINIDFPNKPPPPLRRIIPLQHSEWNAEKSGSDVDTKLADSLAILHPKPNLGTRAVNREIADVMTIIHRLMHVLDSSSRYQNCISLTQYRGNASKRHSFLDTIMVSRRTVFTPIGKGLLDPESNSNRTLEMTPQRRMTRNEAINESLKPSYETPPTGLTPLTVSKKKRALILHPGSDNTFAKRKRTCPGIMVRAHVKDSDRGRCVVCSEKTFWFCVGCRLWLCNTVRTERDCEKRGWKKKTVKHPSNNQDMPYYEDGNRANT